MKRSYTIELEDGDTTFEITLALNAGKWRSVCWDLDQWLRGKIKYEDVESMPTQELRDKLWELLRDEDLNFDE